jgi:hypothetical protein
LEIPQFLPDPRELLWRDKPQDLDDVTLIDSHQPVAFRDIWFVQTGLGMTRTLPRERYVVGRAWVFDLR